MVITSIGFITLFFIIFGFTLLVHKRKYKKELELYSHIQLVYILWLHEKDDKYVTYCFSHDSFDEIVDRIINRIPYNNFKSYYYPENPHEVGCDEFIKITTRDQSYRWPSERNLDLDLINFSSDFCLYIVWVHTLFTDTDFFIKFEKEKSPGLLLGSLLPDIFLKKDYYPEYPNDVPKEFKDWKDSLSLHIEKV